MSSSSKGALPSRFRSFLARINGLEQQIRGRMGGGAVGKTSLAELEPDAIRKNLAATLASLGKASRSGNGLAAATVGPARALMAAVADKVFSELDWWGKEAWTSDPLGTGYPPLGGDLMTQMEGLLANPGPGSLELAETYLLGLEVGFRGRPEGAEGEARVADLKQRLWKFVLAQKPGLASLSTHLFPDAYVRYQRPGPTQFLPDVGRWRLITSVLAVVLLGASLWAWMWASETPRELVGRLLDLLERLPAEKLGGSSWTFGSPVDGSLLFLSFAGLVLVLLLVLLLRVFKRAEANAAYYVSQGSAGETSVAGVKMVDLRASPDTEILRRSFRKALRSLRRYIPGPRARYQIPWFLGLGQSWAGKTTSLGQTKLSLPLGESEAGAMHPPLNWWFFERALVLDLRGDMVLRSDNPSSDLPTWSTFLRMLRRRRSLRPSDCIVLTIPATELIGFDASDPEARSRLASRAEVLRRNLVLAQQQLSMQLPVFVLVTKTDEVAGYAGFLKTLHRDQRAQMFGWSNPEAIDEPYSGAWVASAFDSVDKALARHQLLSLGSGEVSDSSRETAAFPAAIGALEEPLQIYLNQIFSLSAGAEGFPWRGLYFAGGEGFRAPDDSPHHLADVEEGDHNDHQTVDFLTDLFSYKIFYEWNLGVPTSVAATKGEHRVHRLQVVFFLFLLLGPLALWWSARRVSEHADVLSQQFLSPAIASLERQNPPDGQTERDSAQLLLGVNRVADYRLRSLFLPGSWLSRYGGRVLDATTGTYERIIFPGTKSLLGRRLDTVIDGVQAQVAASSKPIYSITDVPDFQVLSAAMADLEPGDEQVGLYDCFSAPKCSSKRSVLLDQLNQLVDGVYRKETASGTLSLGDLAPPSRAAERFVGEVLQGVVVLPYRTAEQSRRLQAKVDTLGTEMYQRLYEQNVLTRDLSLLESQINGLLDDMPEGEEVIRRCRALLATLEITERDLALPGVQWAGNTSFDLGADYDRLLAAIATSRFLGLESARRIRREGTSGFEQLRATLAGYSTSATGWLLARENGEVQLQLAPEMLLLKTTLQSLLQQSFMQPQREVLLQETPPPGTYLVWDPSLLAEATGLYTSYQTFVEEGLKDIEVLQKAARTLLLTVEDNMLRLVARAQSFPRSPDTFTNQLLEGHIKSQVSNLTISASSLGTLLTQFEMPPPGTDCSMVSVESYGYCQLDATVLNQEWALLNQQSQLLTAENLYIPSGGDFSWWDGSGNLAYQAFGVRDDSGLKSYVTGQRQIVQRIGQQYAQPTLTSVQTKDDWAIEDEDSFRLFKVLLSDLDDYTAKKPSNALLQLEDFIAQSMPAMTLSSCLTDLPAAPSCFSDLTPTNLQVSPPCDYFLDALGSLRDGIALRCDQLTVEQGVAAYRAIEQSFVDRLMGKYPFLEQPSQPYRAEATPADIGSFFGVYDQQTSRVTNMLEVAATTPEAVTDPSVAAGLEAVQTFMAQMQQVREFFSYFLTQWVSNSAAVPIYDLQVQFWVNRDMEKGGNEIITWSFEIGQTTVEPGEIDPPARWTFAQPVSSRLRWAKDGPSLPLSPRLDANARLVDLTLIFEYPNGWSLVSYLEDHQTPPVDFRAGVDPKPETLRFCAHTTPAGTTAVPSETTSCDKPDVKVFQRVTLLSPDGKKVEVPFPETFPFRAPTLGRSGPPNKKSASASP